MIKRICSFVLTILMAITLNSTILLAENDFKDSNNYNQEDVQKIRDYLAGGAYITEFNFSYPFLDLEYIREAYIVTEDNLYEHWNDENIPYITSTPIEIYESNLDNYYIYMNSSITNSDVLSYDINKPETWDAVEWKEFNGEKRVVKINIPQTKLSELYIVVWNTMEGSWLPLGSIMEIVEFYNGGYYDDTELNLKNFPYLEYLDLSNTKLNVSDLDLSEYPNIKSLNCYNCGLNLKDLIELNSKYTLTEDSFTQNILNPTSYITGDMKDFGNGTSTTYKWYENGEEIIDPIFKGSKYDFSEFSDYIGKTLYCEISDKGITLKTNSTTITDSQSTVDIEIEILNPPESILKTDKEVETQLKAVVTSMPAYADIDKTISWELPYYNGSYMQIDNNGLLTISPEETETKVVVRAKSNYNSSKYDDVTITLKSDLLAPTNLRWENKVAHWDKVDNCSGYELELFKDGVSIKTISFDSADKTNRSLEAYFTFSGNYTFRVKAIGDGTIYNDSPYAESETQKYSNDKGLQEAINQGKDLCAEGANPSVDDLLKAIANLSKEIILYSESK